MIAAAIVSAGAAAAANIVGALAVTSRARWSMRALDLMIAFSAGFMMSVALVDMLPDAIVAIGPPAAVIALLGYLAVHLTQHTFAGHFHFGEETHAVTRSVSVSALVGLLLHTFVDGVAIASGFFVSDSLGMLVVTAIVLHKLPEGLAISSLFLAAGAGRQRAILAAAALGLATIAGVLVTSLVEPLTHYGLALASGVTLYVAASNLVPEFQAKGGWRLPAAFLAGSGMYFLARLAVMG